MSSATVRHLTVVATDVDRSLLIREKSTRPQLLKDIENALEKAVPNAKIA